MLRQPRQIEAVQPSPAVVLWPCASLRAPLGRNGRQAGESFRLFGLQTLGGPRGRVLGKALWNSWQTVGNLGETRGKAGARNRQCFSGDSHVLAVLQSAVVASYESVALPLSYPGLSRTCGPLRAR